MHARYVEGITIRPLRDGDTTAVAAVLERLGDTSRARRFGGAKPRLSERELAALARVDGDHHVLLAYVEAMAQLAREGRTAEVACAVADAYQRRGVGSVLTRELAADARAAGITAIHATVAGDNPQAVALLTRCAKTLEVTWSGGAREFVVGLTADAA
jgi:ribosomal protein S18 acetylase RimI-like enzyme